LKVYTRRGDAGDTDLFGGPRVGKEDARVEAYGAVDEANAAVGVAAALSAHEDLRAICRDAQERLFDLGGTLATPDADRRRKSAVPALDADDVEALERHIDALEGELEPLSRFVLPGGSPAAAAFHLARTVCRRAERIMVELKDKPGETVTEASLQYVNRLSDFLFVAGRYANDKGARDILWAPGQNR